MADGALGGLGNLGSQLGEIVKDEAKTVGTAAAQQVGIPTPKPKNLPTQQQINDMAAKDKTQTATGIKDAQAELNSMSGKKPQEAGQQRMAQEHFQEAQMLGQPSNQRQQQEAQQKRMLEEEEEKKARAKKALPPLSEGGVIGKMGTLSDVALKQAQTKIEDKAGHHG